MIVDWLKENLIATITGAVLAGSAISGSVVYVVDQTAPSIGPQTSQGASAVVPSQFRVHISGNLQGGLGSYGRAPIEGETSFICDLTIHAEKYCQSGTLAPRSGKSIGLQLHAGDPTKFRIVDSGSADVTGISWEKLLKGVRAFGVTIKAEPIDPKT